jgi:hypothetical protein
LLFPIVLAHELHFFRRFDLLQPGEMHIPTASIIRFSTRSSPAAQRKAAEAMRSHTSGTAPKILFEAERSEITLKNQAATNRLGDLSFQRPDKNPAFYF